MTFKSLRQHEAQCRSEQPDARSAHRCHYDWLARQIGLARLVSLVSTVATPERLAEAHAQDQLLNTIPLASWDRAGGGIAMGCLSMAEKVSVLKHVARHYVLSDPLDFDGAPDGNEPGSSGQIDEYGSRRNTRQNRRTFGPSPIAGWGEGATLKAIVEWDDTCFNGHNTFSVTGEIRLPTERDIVAGGCLHDEIASVFPQLAEAIGYHLWSSTGPLNYIANTTFLAGDCDHSGRRRGEPTAFTDFVRFGDVPVLHAFKGRLLSLIKRVANGEIDRGDLAVVEVEHGEDQHGYHFKPKWSVIEPGAALAWYQCAFDTETEAAAMLATLRDCTIEIVRTPSAFSEGKERQLDLARRSANWPDATDEDLTEPGLEQRLRDRLPAMMARFKSIVESLGFEY